MFSTLEGAIEMKLCHIQKGVAIKQYVLKETATANKKRKKKQTPNMLT